MSKTTNRPLREEQVMVTDPATGERKICYILDLPQKYPMAFFNSLIITPVDSLASEADKEEDDYAAINLRVLHSLLKARPTSSEQRSTEAPLNGKQGGLPSGAMYADYYRFPNEFASQASAQSGRTRSAQGYPVYESVRRYAETSGAARLARKAPFEDAIRQHLMPEGVDGDFVDLYCIRLQIAALQEMEATLAQRLEAHSMDDQE